MTANIEALHQRLVRHPHRTRRRPQWRRAFRSLKALLNDPQKTAMAVDIFVALNPHRHEDGLQEFLAHPEGQRLYFERPDLAAALTDRKALEALPPNSFGRAYLRHLDRFGLDLMKLVQLQHDSDPERGKRPEGLQWYIDRVSLQHDLWHTLSGYGADGPGESVLLAFTTAQRNQRADWLLTLGAGWRTVRHVGLRAALDIWRGWRRGRKAVYLDVVPYEELLGNPLEDVRRMLGIEPPSEVHPKGLFGFHALEPGA